MTAEEAWGEVVTRRLYVMPPAGCQPTTWYVTDDARTSHGFGENPVAAIKDFLKNMKVAPVAEDLSFLE